ncbi:hypothetical protein BpHYR1_052565 [Brachionus plicatilis]|uniref:Uncharacterized protein n=1 Tax=Brachionus plicatilis TaxID=10195 RepID=A0A3M7P975_BRAPC|nr:hypothetical protein BpHYR1_052565 [Brachionus plicatilis]
MKILKFCFYCSKVLDETITRFYQKQTRAKLIEHPFIRCSVQQIVYLKKFFNLKTILQLSQIYIKDEKFVKFKLDF